MEDATHEHALASNGANFSESVRHRQLRGAARWKMFLLSSFDAMLVSILWLLVVKAGAVGNSEFKNAIKTCAHQCFNDSVLDIVGLAILRFIILTGVYTVLASVATWPVVLSTAGSSVYLICKVYLYASRITQEWDYALFVASFVVSWAEVFLHASAIAPLSKMSKRARRAENTSTIPMNEEAPLLDDASSTRGMLVPGRRLPPVFDSQGSASINQYATPALSDMDSDAFGTPTSGTPSGTPRLHRAMSAGSRNDAGGALLSPEGLAKLDERLIQLCRHGQEAVQDTWDMAVNPRFEWQTILEKSGVTVSQCTIGSRSVLKSEGLVRVSPSVLFHILYYKDTARTSWNPVIEQFEVLEELDRFSDVTYSVFAPQARGLVSARDFVCVRQWNKRDGNVVIAENVTEHPARLAQDGSTVRGELGPGGYVLLTVPGQPHVTNLIWVFNVDFKGWIARYLVDNTMSHLLVVHHERVRSLVPPSTAGQRNEEIYI